MKYVVTGGAGFIGSHLAESLTADPKTEVVILDDLSVGKEENCAGFIGRPNVRLVRGSVTDPEMLATVCAGADGIFHQAAVASVPKSVADPVGSHAVNLTGTLNVLCAARDAGARKVVFASSAAVYGDPATFPVHENMNADPLSPYAAQKYGCEKYGRIFSDLYGVDVVGLRYFNVYGPRQDPTSPYSGVISVFADRISAGMPITVHGDGTQTRDFIFVEDVVRANRMAMERAAPGVYNIATGRETNLLELAGMLMEATGKEVPVGYGPAREEDVNRSVAAVEKAKEAFSFVVKVPVREGLKRLLAGNSG